MRVYETPQETCHPTCFLRRLSKVYFKIFVLIVCALVYTRVHTMFRLLYRNNLKNRFLAASDFPHNLHSYSGLAVRQWSLAPNANSEDPPCQNSDSSSYFGIKSNF